MSIDGLINRLYGATEPDNDLDLDVAIALFKPDENYFAVRKNSAGTKLVYDRRGGGTDTFIAPDYTLDWLRTKAAIEALEELE